MSKIYYMMGKSSTGKDTLYKRVFSDASLQLKTLVSYTTRPIRDGETDGVEYFFCDEAKVLEFVNNKWLPHANQQLRKIAA